MKFREIFNFFKKYFKAEKKLFIISFICFFISSILGVLFGYLVGRATDEAVSGNFTIAILILAGYLLSAIINYMVFSRIGRISLHTLCNNTMEKISNEVYYKVCLLPARAFEEKTSGELINRVVNDSSTIAEVFRQIINTVGTIFSAFLIFIYIMFNSWIIALIILIYFVIFYMYTKRFLPIVKQTQKEINIEKDKTVAEVNETIRGIREIRALGIRKNINNVVKRIINKTFIMSKKQKGFETNYYSVTNTFGAFLATSVFITCIILIAVGKSTIGFFISMTYYIYRFTYLVEWMMEMTTAYQKAKVAIERVTEILDNKLYPDIKFGSVNKTDIVGNIEFKNVTFKYSKEEENILENFYLKIPSHKKIAIVGKSGQGKSTIFNLLLRYFDPNSGEILIDDIPIADFDENSFNQNIAIIRQDPFIFNKTILENFHILDPYMSLNKIRNACKMAEIDEYIMSLPNKYETKIGEGGVNLSGGQKQRLAIARALLKSSSIILFDEATSALDNENQSKIKKAIDNLVTNHTVIIIAHRLSTIIDADIIYLIDKGKVVASGTHKELMKKNKIYKNLYNNEN